MTAPSWVSALNTINHNSTFTLTPPHPPKEHPMTEAERTARLAAVDTELARLREKNWQQTQKQKNRLERIGKLVAERAALAYPPEPTARYIRFSKQFVSGAKIYEYVAIRTETRWYVSGATAPNGVSWKQLVDFIRLDNRGDTSVKALTSPLVPSGSYSIAF